VTTSSTTASGVVEWLSNDPIGISGGLNQYVFCGNNPVNFRDPFGLCEDSEGTGFMDWLHGILDVGGTFEPTPFCDLGNALLYSFQGEWGYAGVSVAGVLPYIGDTAKIGKYGGKGAKLLSRRAKTRLAKEIGGIPRSAQPVAQGTFGKGTRWWEYASSQGERKIVVQHPDGTVHVGTPKPQSTHLDGGPPKYYPEPGTGHIGE
jgi:hypothetical protein